MSLCEACRKALPYIPASEGNEGSIATISNILSEHGDWHRSQLADSTECWYLREPFLLHISRESLVTSLNHDCPICWTLWRNIRSSPIASLNNERIAGFEAEITEIEYYPDSHQYYVIMRLMGHRLEIKEFIFSIWKTTEKYYLGKQLNKALGHLLFILVNAKLEAERETPLAVQHTPNSAADVANRWIKTCEAKHSQCLKRAAPPEHSKMPTRLLDLGNANSKAWRIYQDPVHVPYAALSHRWSSDTPELHTKNYKNYCDSQPDSVLPQNYQDIISICCAIPIQYLWIDSLCIIQDDNGDDFRREAPLMMDVYQYAFLTLSICWDFPGLSIFRRCRPRSIPRPRPSGYYGEGDYVSESDEWVFAEETRHRELEAFVSGAPINQRAWVLQERCLSRRLLYLGNDQLYWECDGCTGSEVSPDSIYKDGGRQSILDLSGCYKDTAWSLTLTKYTGSDLTFEKDRLIAIAGLAKLVASKTGGTYLAGIWLDSWMQDLLWEPVRGGARSLRLKPEELTMVPPSWSWLGYSGSVGSSVMLYGEGPKISTVTPNIFESDEYQLLALLSQAGVIPSTSDPFSSFERAILKVRCLLLPVTFAGIPGRNEQPWFFRHERDIELSSVGLDYLRLQACKPSHDIYITFRFHFSKPVDFSLQYFLVPLYLRQELERDSWPHGVYGLALQKCLSGGNQEFIRVGIWKEDHRYSSQLNPIISNTIVKLSVGKNSTCTDGSLTENERVFDSKLGEYAADRVASKVRFPIKIVKRVMEYQPDIEEVVDEAGTLGSGATEQKVIKTDEGKGPLISDEEVECSLLPHLLLQNGLLFP